MLKFYLIMAIYIELIITWNIFSSYNSYSLAKILDFVPFALK